jgi:hypothetical protein
MPFVVAVKPALQRNGDQQCLSTIWKGNRAKVAGNYSRSNLFRQVDEVQSDVAVQKHTRNLFAFSSLQTVQNK